MAKKLIFEISYFIFIQITKNCLCTRLTQKIIHLENPSLTLIIIPIRWKSFVFQGATKITSCRKQMRCVLKFPQERVVRVRIRRHVCLALHHICEVNWKTTNTHTNIGREARARAQRRRPLKLYPGRWRRRHKSPGSHARRMKTNGSHSPPACERRPAGRPLGPLLLHKGV